MDIKTLVVVCLAIGVAACAREEPAQPEASPGPPPETATVLAVVDESMPRGEEFIAHMHMHADTLDELNFALEDGDLEAAKAAAHWLAKHDTVQNMPTEWMPMLFAMRSEAEAVVAAEDLKTAHAAAARIVVRCQKCHSTAGVGVQL